jgi:hypothetical protein
MSWFDPTAWKGAADLVTDWKTIGGFLVVVFGALWRWGLPVLRRLGQRRMVTWQLITLIGAAWLLITVVLGGLAWVIASSHPAEAINNPPATGAIIVAQNDGGPLSWFAGMVILEHQLPLGPVFSVRFKGINSSQREVQLKSAELISAINGKRLPLEILAQTEIVPINQIELIPPQAPIELIGKFGSPDPANPGKILGIDAKTFLESWRQFFFTAEDDTRKYRIPYNETNVAPFFPWLVGPHVTKKAKALEAAQ